MKKIFSFALLGLLGFSVPSLAQTKVDKAANKVEKGAVKAWHGSKKGASKAWKGTKKGAKAVDNETAELATTGKAIATDKKSKLWEGPKGQTIYINNEGKYYWINGKGKKIYVSQAALRTKKKGIT